MFRAAVGVKVKLIEDDIPLLCEERWPRHQKYCEASLDGADGVVRAAKPYSFLELTTPSAPLRWLRSIFLMAQPPLLCEEGNVHYSRTP